MKSYQKNSEIAKQKLFDTLRKAQKESPIEKVPFPEISNETPYYPSENGSLVDIFLSNFEAIQGQGHIVSTMDEAHKKVSELSDLKGWKQIYIADESLDFLAEAQKTKNLSADCDASITRCDYLVARTGSVIITSHLAAGRQGTIYPPEHLIIATEDQILWDISDGLAEVATRPQMPSMINLNTGPSRTADIEKTLVVGIHGPKEVNLILIKK